MGLKAGIIPVRGFFILWSELIDDFEAGLCFPSSLNWVWEAAKRLILPGALASVVRPAPLFVRIGAGMPGKGSGLNGVPGIH